HQLWSRAGASPHTRYFRHAPFRVQPFTGCQFPITKILEHVNLALIELPDQQILCAVTVHIGPARSGITRTFYADSDTTSFQPFGTLEVRSATDADSACQPQHTEENPF